MKVPELPANEPERQRALESLNILETAMEEHFERLTRLASRLLDVPIAAISLIDGNRQWFKSLQGLGMTEAPRETSFCGHTILDESLLVVEDAMQDERFADEGLYRAKKTGRDRNISHVEHSA